MTGQPYPTDLTDAQWAVLRPLVPPAKPGGRPRGADEREVIAPRSHVAPVLCCPVLPVRPV